MCQVILPPVRARFDWIHQQCLEVGNLPQEHCAILTSTSERSSIRTERDAVDSTYMPGEYPMVYARDRIPQPYCAILTPSCERPPIRTERNASDRMHIPGECPLMFGLRHDIPQTDGSVIPTLPLASDSAHPD